MSRGYHIALKGFIVICSFRFFIQVYFEVEFTSNHSVQQAMSVNKDFLEYSPEDGVSAEILLAGKEGLTYK